MHSARVLLCRQKQLVQRVAGSTVPNTQNPVYAFARYPGAGITLLCKSGASGFEGIGSVITANCVNAPNSGSGVWAAQDYCCASRSLSLLVGSEKERESTVCIRVYVLYTVFVHTLL